MSRSIIVPIIMDNTDSNTADRADVKSRWYTTNLIKAGLKDEDRTPSSHVPLRFDSRW